MKNRKKQELFGCLSRVRRACVKSTYAASVLGVLIFAGCNTDIKENDFKFAEESGSKVTFSAVIDEQQGSQIGNRATETNWEIGDCVGITCGDKQVNVQYRYSGDAGNYFYAVNDRKEIWLLGTEEYEVSAYYPYRGEDGVEEPAFVVETSSENQATEELRQALDFLYASGIANHENPNVELVFNHVMSRIVLKFVPGDIDKLSDIDCYILGLKLDGTFNPNTGVTTVNGNAVARDLNQVLTDDNDHTLTAYFLPQTIDNGIIIEAGMNGIYYRVDVDLPSLQAGYSYTYTVTTNDYNDNPIKLTITGTEINPWTSVDGGNLDPDPSLAGTDADITPGGWGDITEEEITPTEVN
ncbi:MAG: fimbrillin family protein [Bacteroides sp.]|nr:fimbrillin family protein [Bacteroides sp.]